MLPWFQIGSLKVKDEVVADEGYKIQLNTKAFGKNVPFLEEFLVLSLVRL